MFGTGMPNAFMQRENALQHPMYQQQIHGYVTWGGKTEIGRNSAAIKSRKC